MLVAVKSSLIRANMLSTVASLKRKITVVQISVITVMNGLTEDVEGIVIKNKHIIYSFNML